MTEHICDLRSAWPVGHPLPPIDTDKLEGPHIGALCVITGKYKTGRIVRIEQRSYVWSPGECRHKGGYRRYDWSVVSDEHGYEVVMNDSDLIELEPGMDIGVMEINELRWDS